MHKSTKWWLVAGSLCFVFFVCQPVQAQRVVYRSGLPDLGLATYDRSGKPVIMLNANLCRRRPDLCEFVRAHEIAHHRLGHLNRNMSVRQAEFEADRWAATHSSPQALRAAKQFFGSGYGGTIQNGSSRQRLATINRASASQRSKVHVKRVPAYVKRKAYAKRKPTKTVHVVRTSVVYAR